MFRFSYNHPRRHRLPPAACWYRTPFFRRYATPFTLFRRLALSRRIALISPFDRC